MKNKQLVFCKALLFSLIICTHQAVLANDDNPLKDAGFEQQLSPDQGGWTLFDQSRFSSMFNWGFSQAIPSPPFLRGTASGSFQEFPATPGSQWRLSGYGMTPTALKGSLAFGIVQLSFFDDEGNDLGTVETSDSKTPKAKLSNQVNTQTTVNEWVLLDIGIATAPPNTTKVQAFTLYVDYSGSGIPQGVYFDDLVLCNLNSGSVCK